MQIDQPQKNISRMASVVTCFLSAGLVELALSLSLGRLSRPDGGTDVGLVENCGLGGASDLA